MIKKCNAVLYSSSPLNLESSSMSGGMRLLACHSRQKKKRILLLWLVLDYFPFPSIQSSPLHSLISYSHLPLILPKMSPAVHDPRSVLVHAYILTFLIVMCCSTKVPPFLYSNKKACGAGQCADQCANLNNLSPAARVKHCVMGRLLCTQKAAVFSFFFFFSLQPAKAAGCMVKIDHFARVGGRHLRAPPLADMFLASTGMNQMVGT